MARNGSGTMQRTDGVRTSSTLAADQKSLGIAVTASLYDAEHQDVADEITNSVAVDGQSTMSGNLKMGSNKITGVVAGSDQFEVLVYDQESIRLRSEEADANENPVLDLWRNSTSPADGDKLAVLRFSGEDSAGNKETYAKLVGEIDDVTSGTEDGSLVISTLVGGSQTEAMRISGILTLIGKDTADSGATAGLELPLDGTNYLTTTGGTPLNINRLSDDGKLIVFRQDGTEQGDISVSGSSVTLTGFQGAHPGEWDSSGIPAQDPPNGTVLSATDEFIDELHPKVKITEAFGDRSVYGVYQQTAFGFTVASVGLAKVRVSGPVQRGDLLVASQFPGVAVRQFDHTVRANTLGKALQTDTSVGEKLITVALMAG